MTKPTPAPDPTNDAKITREEMVEMFGTEMPIEAAVLLWHAPDGWTIGEVRAELRKIAGGRDGHE